MNISENTQQKFSMIFNLGMESLKIFMACLLTLFVPQKCGDHECSMEEKLTDNKYYAVTSLNVFTIFVFLRAYYKEYSRERFLINHFKSDIKLPDNNLRHIVSQNPKLLQKVLDYNKSFYNFTMFAIIIGIINFLSSGIVIIYYHYDGFRTISSMLTSLLLVSKTLSSNYYISKQSRNRGLGLSTVFSEPKSYNDLERQFKILAELGQKTNNLDSPRTIEIKLEDKKQSSK